MSDPISLASAIAGLVALADVVFTKSLRYVHRVKSADKTINDLVRLLQSMSGTLHVLRQRLSVLSADSSQAQPLLPPQILNDCARLLDDVNKQLSKYDKAGTSKNKKKFSSKLQALKWPFDESSTKDLLDQLTKFNQVLDTAMTADTMIVVHQTFQAAGQLREDIKKLERSMSEKVARLTAITLSQGQNEAVSFFKSTHAADRHKIAMKLWQEGTGGWFTESDDLRRWFEGRDPRLWLSGIPGAGKTVLASAIIEKTRKEVMHSNGDMALAFFYCDYKDIATQDISTILNSVISQISVCNNEALAILLEHYTKFCKPGRIITSDDRPSQTELIHKLTSIFKRLFIIVDGLDECGHNVSETVRELRDLNPQSCSNISTLFLSRKEHEINQVLSDEYLHISIAARNTDLKLYVYAQMERRTKDERLVIEDPDVRDKIIDKLINNADGM